MDPKKPAKPTKPTSKPATPAAKGATPPAPPKEQGGTKPPVKPASTARPTPPAKPTPAARPSTPPAAKSVNKAPTPPPARPTPMKSSVKPASPIVEAARSSVGQGAIRSLNQTKKTEFQAKANLQKAKQQQLRTQRASAARPTAASTLEEETRKKLVSLQSDFDNLQDDIMLSSVYDDMGRVEGVLLSLPTDLAALRMQNYVFGNFLENKISVLTNKWEQLYDQMGADVTKMADDLAGEATRAERMLHVALAGNQTMLSRAEAAVQSLNSKASSARQALTNRYSDVSTTIHQTREQLDQLKWVFEQANEACFDFLQGEYVVAGCKAKLLKEAGSDEGETGNLYLTDSRLIFEQKEKVATKKILFITTASEMVQECRLTALIGWVEKVEAEDTRKFLSTKDLLHLQFSREAPVSSATFQLLDGAKNEGWVQLVNRVRVGDIDKERIASAVEEKAAADEQVQAVPTVCSTCGATLPTQVVRGQTTITCEYCNTVIRL